MIPKSWVNSKALPLGVLVVCALSIGSYIVFGHSDTVVKTETVQTVLFQDPKTGLKLEHPTKLRSPELTQEDTKANIHLRLVEEQGEKPLLITVRSETGLRVVAAVTKQELLHLLMNNSEKAFPQRFKGFTKVSSRTVELNGIKAGEIVFTYDVPDGTRAKQRFIIYPKDNNTAVYVAMQAREADFDLANAETFEPIVKSLNF